MKWFGPGLAFALAAALLAIAAPAASAGQPDPVAERNAEKQAQQEAARESEKAARESEKAAKEAERPDAPGKAKDKPSASGKKQASGRPCEERVFARVFKPWHDRGHYTLAPGGDFETAAEGWTLEGAAVAADSSPFLLGAALGASSLELAAGATAVSPPICVERGFPNFRLVARSATEEQAVVKVEVLYADGRSKKAGRLKPAAAWTPTRKISLAQGRFKIRRGRSAQVQLRFAVTSGTVRLDDVYIDPWIRR